MDLSKKTLAVTVLAALKLTNALPFDFDEKCGEACIIEHGFNFDRKLLECLNPCGSFDMEEFADKFLEIDGECIKDCLPESGKFDLEVGMCMLPCTPLTLEDVLPYIPMGAKEPEVVEVASSKNMIEQIIGKIEDLPVEQGLCVYGCINENNGVNSKSLKCALKCVGGPDLPFVAVAEEEPEVKLASSGILDDLPIESIVGKIDNLPIEEALCIKACIDENGGLKFGPSLLKCAVPCVPGATEKVMEVVMKANKKIDVMCAAKCYKENSKLNLESAMCLLGCVKGLPDLPFVAVAEEEPEVKLASSKNIIEEIIGKIEDLPIEQGLCVYGCINENNGVNSKSLKCALKCVGGPDLPFLATKRRSLRH